MERTEEERSPSWVSRETLIQYEVVAMLAVSVALVVWSLLSPAPLGEQADPATTPAAVSAPWIFAWVQELLRHLPPVIAGALLPVALFATLSLIPFVSPRAATEGEAAPRMPAGLILILILGAVSLMTLLHFIR